MVEFVARNRAAFQALFSDRTIQLFEKGRQSKIDIETQLRLVRKGFDLDQFGTVLP